MSLSTWCLAAALLPLFVLACSYSFTNKDSIPVATESSADANLEVAKAVATQVWESGLLKKISQEFPDLSESELQGIGIRWNTLKTKPLLGEDREEETKISIQCVFQQKRGLEFGQPVVKFCLEVVKSALDAYTSHGSST